MPSWFPENNTPLPGDNPFRSLQKITSCDFTGFGGTPATADRVTDDGGTRLTDDGGTRVVEP